jgi:hypothetical protein
VHGRTAHHAARWLPLLLSACAGPITPAPETPADPSGHAAQFDPALAGTIHGTVRWSGAVPAVHPFSHRLTVVPADAAAEARLRANPNAPVIDADLQGVGGAVIILRGVDATRARPWDHPPVRVEQRDLHLHVQQGAVDCGTGIVRRGERVEMVSRDAVVHQLRARGTAFFTLAFPDPDDPCSRPLSHAGLVELSSGVGYFWMRAYLFVDDHPYYARTDTEGQFTLPQVPAGRYEIVCWMPNWIEDRNERDPESGRVVRLWFRPPAVMRQVVEVRPGAVQEVRFSPSLEQFEQ